MVGAVGTGAPWFLTGWEEGTEGPYSRRLVSADSSTLVVRGELCKTIVFLGLQCNMMLIIASIGSEGLLGAQALQACLPHQLDLRTGQLWADGQSTLPVHQQRQAVRASAYTQGSLVVPPDIEMIPMSKEWNEMN